jgi:hypothetical protein
VRDRVHVRHMHLIHSIIHSLIHPPTDSTSSAHPPVVFRAQLLLLALDPCDGQRGAVPGWEPVAVLKRITQQFCIETTLHFGIAVPADRLDDEGGARRVGAVAVRIDGH